MELARREFLKESMATLGFLALPGGLFAVPTGWKPKGKKPNLVLGVMSDSHLRVGYDAVTPGRAFPCLSPVNRISKFRHLKSPGLQIFRPLRQILAMFLRSLRSHTAKTRVIRREMSCGMTTPCIAPMRIHLVRGILQNGMQ